MLYIKILIKVDDIPKHHTRSPLYIYGKALITPSNATNAIAFAGNALKKHGRNPLQ